MVRRREAVADDPGRQAEDDVGHDLDREDQARDRLRAGRVEHEPRQRDARDPVRGRVERLRGEEQQPVPARQQRIRAQRACFHPRRIVVAFAAVAADTVVLVDGERRDPSAPAVPPLDPGLLGHGVYESIRTYGGLPFALDRHLDRLADGAAALGIPCPRDALAREVPAAVTARAASGETRIRLQLTAGGVRIVAADALPDRRRDRAEGLRARCLPWRRDPGGPTMGVKASSTAAVRVAQRWLADRDAEVGIWLTSDECVVEALAANVFAIVGGRARDAAARGRPARRRDAGEAARLGRGRRDPGRRALAAARGPRRRRRGARLGDLGAGGAARRPRRRAARRWPPRRRHPPAAGAVRGPRARLDRGGSGRRTPPGSAPAPRRRTRRAGAARRCGHGRPRCRGGSAPPGARRARAGGSPSATSPARGRPAAARSPRRGARRAPCSPASPRRAPPAARRPGRPPRRRRARPARRARRTCRRRST